MKTAKLYEMSEGFNNIFDLCLDESMDLDELEAGLKDIEEELDVKCRNGIAIIQQLTALANAAGDESRRLAAKAKAINNNVARLKQYYMENLKAMGKTRVDTELGTMRIQKNPPAYKFDAVEKWEDEVPEEYLNYIPAHYELNREKARKAVKAGVNLPCCHVVQGESLRIS